ncbi:MULTISPECIES: UvrD-helicase domain-containing protein [unclassified Paenibacillus]|uniref:UvrD-helicase domain-containing protein n=1 Tax=unclassified Paenibacillus TaxID=185978 RepID=UPI003636C930
MSEPQFHKVPLGAGSKTIPYAPMAELTTSTEIVTDDDSDAFFFRDLEMQGIRLNAPQIQAVRHFNGPLLTLAGAGSGKTTVLVCRAAYLVAVHRVDPRSLLLVTFSKKAAEEMKERISLMPGLNKQLAATIQARTFHSFCLQIIRTHGFDQEIITNTRYQQISVKRILLEMGLQETYQPEVLLSLLSSYKMQMIELSELPDSTAEEKELKQIFLRYEEWKQASHQIDFDDILLNCYHLLKQKPAALRSLQQRFTYISVDEFQDTNLVQYELIKMVGSTHENLMIVGDDDQTIYSFNGARHEFILQFDQRFPTAKTVTLDINYRSTPSIVGLGNAVIRHNKERKKKTLRATKHSEAAPPQYIRPSNSDEEAEWILSHLLRQVNESIRGYGDAAILYRSASNSRAIIEQFILHNIPFIDYGDKESFYEQWMVKPVIDHLSLALNRRSFEAIEGILGTLYINREQGIRIIQDQEAIQAKKWPLIHLLGLPQLKDFQKEKIKERIKLIKSLASLKPLNAIQLIRRDFYDSFLETNKQNKVTHQKELLKETLDELESSAKRFDTLESFLSFVQEVVEKRRDMKLQKSDNSNHKVSLMTIHKSKGLEFPVVYLIGACEGNMPHSSALDVKQMKDVFPRENSRNKEAAALEEERRLAYVAITRAKDDLIISSPAYYRGKKADPSRFLLSAFPKPKLDANSPSSTRTTTTTRKSTLGGPIVPARITPTGIIEAWICTSSRCKTWQRITSSADAELSTKACPLCKSAMAKGSKDLSVRND